MDVDKTKIPVGVKSISEAYLIGSVLLFCVSIFFVVGFGTDDYVSVSTTDSWGVIALLGYIGIAYSLMCYVIGVGLRKLKPWARYGPLIVGISCIIPFGGKQVFLILWWFAIPNLAISAYLLFNQNVKKIFI